LIPSIRQPGPEKSRVGYLNGGPLREKKVANLTGVQLTLPGIPCIYYGTEQALKGYGLGDKCAFPILLRMVRLISCTLGILGRTSSAVLLLPTAYRAATSLIQPILPTFESQPWPIFALVQLRASLSVLSHLSSLAYTEYKHRQDRIGQTLRHGRMYIRDICPISPKRQQHIDAVRGAASASSLGRSKKGRASKRAPSEEELIADEGLRRWRSSHRGELLAWSRIHYNTEVIIVLNTHPLEERQAFITVDRRIQEFNQTKLPRSGKNPLLSMTMLYYSEWSNAVFESMLTMAPFQSPTQVPILKDKEERHYIVITLPPAAMAILH